MKFEEFENYYYVDKTRFIETVEASAPFLFLIRPRRFGKSLWLNTMKAYYDLNKANQFDDLFGETYIGQHPTEERNKYFILSFNFSSVDADLTTVKSSFEEHCQQSFEAFYDTYSSILGEEFIIGYAKYKTAESRMEFVSRYCLKKNLSIYLSTSMIILPTPFSVSMASELTQKLHTVMVFCAYSSIN